MATAVAVPVLAVLLSVCTDDPYFKEYMEQVQMCDRPEVPLALEDDLGKLGTVHVVYASNRGHFQGLLASMLSLSRRLAAPRSCHIHVLVERGLMDQARRVAGCFQRELAELPAIPEVTLHELRPVPFNVSSFFYVNFFPGHDARHCLHPETFARFYLDEYLPRVPRVLWLDTDTIVRADVRPLYQMRLRHVLAAVPLPASMDAYLANFYMHKHLPKSFDRTRLESTHRFNAGILLLDLDRWREEKVSGTLERWVRMYHGLDGDQLALNLEFHDRYAHLDWRWNTDGLGHYPWRIPEACADGGKIYHWSGRLKPWNASLRFPLPNDHLFEHPRLRCDL